MSLMRLVFDTLAPAGPGARLTVMIFHRVLPAADPLRPGEPDARRFDELLQWLVAWFNVVSLREAVAALKAGTLPPRALCITFDDGYKDNFEIALPVLQRHGVPATFFVASGFLDGGRMWNDTVIEAVRVAQDEMLEVEALGVGALAVGTTGQKRAAIDLLLARLKYAGRGRREALAESIAAAAHGSLPTDLMMTSRQVQELHRAGMDIGAHSVTHPILAGLSGEDARREISGSKARLEEITGAAVTLFAYPNGRPGKDYSGEHVHVVRELGFAAAFSTAWGVARSGCDLHQIPRFTPWDQQWWRYAVRLARNLRLTQPDAVAT